MTKNRIITAVLAVLVLCSALAFSGCGTVINSISDLFGNGNQSGQSGEEEIETIPEAGSWHAAVKLSSIKSVPFWQRALLSIVAGNIAFEVDLEIEQTDIALYPAGTFSYETNTDSLKKKVAESAGTVAGFFLKNVDLTEIIDRAVEGVLPENIMGSADRNCYGVFTKEPGGMINAVNTKGDPLFFKSFGKKLVQLDEEGNSVLTFERP